MTGGLASPSLLLWRRSLSALSSVKLCLSLDEDDCFCAEWAVTALWTLNIFCASKKCLCFVNDKVSCFLCL